MPIPPPPPPLPDDAKPSLLSRIAIAFRDGSRCSWQLPQTQTRGEPVCRSRPESQLTTSQSRMLEPAASGSQLAARRCEEAF